MANMREALKVAGIGAGSPAAVDRQFRLYLQSLELRKSDATPAKAEAGAEVKSPEIKSVLRR
jgi:hypothetical protein